MTTVKGLFTAADGVGASGHKFSSGSHAEGRIAAKAMVKFCLHNEEIWAPRGARTLFISRDDLVIIPSTLPLAWLPAMHSEATRPRRGISMADIEPSLPFRSAVMPQALRAQDRIRFHCHRGNACCKQADVTLAPYDIPRLKRRLGLTSTDLLRHYRVPFRMDSDGPPGIKLKTDDSGACLQLFFRCSTNFLSMDCGVRNPLNRIVFAVDRFTRAKLVLH